MGHPEENCKEKNLDPTKCSNSLGGRDRFQIEVMTRLLDCVIIWLMKRNELYGHIGKRFKFLPDVSWNTDINEDNITLVICHYNEYIVCKLVSECCQFKEYLRLVSSHENLKCTEILQLKDESNLIVSSPNLTAILQVYMTLPITSCEAERNFSKPPLIKNKFWSKML